MLTYVNISCQRLNPQHVFNVAFQTLPSKIDTLKKDVGDLLQAILSTFF